MIYARPVCDEGKALFGTDAAAAHIEPPTWIEALNWACSVLNQQLKVCVSSEWLDTPSRDGFALPESCSELITVSLIAGESVKILFKTEFANMLQRRPSWRVTQKMANQWCFTRANEIAVDGSIEGCSVEIHYLQQPEAIADLDSGYVDERFGAVNPMAFAYLAAAYCLQLAGDASSLEKAQVYFQQGMGLAGVKGRLAMPVTKSGGERATSHP